MCIILALCLGCHFKLLNPPQHGCLVISLGLVGHYYCVIQSALREVGLVTVYSGSWQTPGAIQ